MDGMFIAQKSQTSARQKTERYGTSGAGRSLRETESDTPVAYSLSARKERGARETAIVHISTYPLGTDHDSSRERHPQSHSAFHLVRTTAAL